MVRYFKVRHEFFASAVQIHGVRLKISLPFFTWPFRRHYALLCRVRLHIGDHDLVAKNASQNMAAMKTRARRKRRFTVRLLRVALFVKIYFRRLLATVQRCLFIPRFFQGAENKCDKNGKRSRPKIISFLPAKTPGTRRQLVNRPS